MLQAKPKRLSEDYRVAECDPSGETEYMLVMPGSTVITHLSSLYVEERPAIDEATGLQKKDEKGKPIFANVMDTAGYGMHLLRLSLMGLKGVYHDAEGEKPVELIYNQIKVQDCNHKCLRTEILDMLPPKLYYEMLYAARLMVVTPEKEIDDENFTSSSSSQTGSTPAGTAPDLNDVHTKDAESESDESMTENQE